MVPELDDLGAIKACIDKYVEGAARGDRKLLEEIFLPTARMVGWFAGQCVDVPIVEFFRAAEGNPQSDHGYRAELQSIQLTGTAAVATLAENAYLNHDFVDYLSLIKREDGWKIAHKSFHGESAD